MIAAEPPSAAAPGLSWLVDCPARWAVRPLKALATCLDGQRIPVAASLRAPGSYPYWGANGIQDWVDGYLFNEPLVLLGEDGAPFFEPAKDVAFAVDGPIWVNNHAHVLRPRKNVDVRFLAFALNAVDYTAYITGSTRDKLTQHDMDRIALRVPPLAEQRAIADYLHRETARIDALIAKKERLLRLLDERKKCALEDGVQHLRLTVPLVPLGVLCREIDRRLGMLTPPRLLSVSIHRGVIPFEEANPDREGRADDLIQYKVCRTGDIVLNRMRAFQGGVGRAPENGIVSPDYAVLRPMEPLLSEYLGHLFRSPWFVGEMEARLRGIGSSEQGNVRTPRVNWHDLRTIEVPRPEPSIAKAWAEELEGLFAATDRATAKLTTQLELFSERRSALITAAVTGQLDIPEAA